MKPLVTLAFALAVLAFSSSSALGHADSAPKIMLWAWERNEDLSFLSTHPRVGVAFLASTVLLEGETVRVLPRRQPLRLPSSTYLVSVVRIETSPSIPATFSQNQIQNITREFIRVANLAQVRGLQIDFDATLSERANYRVLLQETRKALPKNKSFSMTALASWCLGDSWIESPKVPVDEAIPMLFDMGSDSAGVRDTLEKTGRFRVNVCQTSMGVSVNQPAPRALVGRRTYVFNSKPWNAATLERILGVYQ